MKKTLAIIKPRAFKENLTGPIINSMYNAGFIVKALKTIRMSKEQAESFYEVHQDKPFFKDLVEFMSSGPVIPVVLEKENAVNDLRKLLGATNPAEAEDDTIRKKFGKDKTKNAVHGADSQENALREIGFFFSSSELIS